MIAPMKKYSFLVYHKEYDAFLLKLRELGVVHLIEKEGTVTENIREQLQKADQVDKMIRWFETRGIQRVEKNSTSEAETLFNEVNDIQTELTHIAQQMANVRKETLEVLPWGDFSTEKIHNLAENGINIRLFTCMIRNWDPAWTENKSVFEISQSGGMVYFAVVDAGEDLPEMDADEIRIPTHSLSQIELRKNELEKQTNQLNKRLDEIAANDLPALINYRQQLLQDVELDKALETTIKEADEHLSILEGWIPAETAEVLNRFLDKTGVLYIRESPVPGDSVPVLLKNKGFSSKFEMLGELYSLPGYKELDLTPFFAPFYTIFFGFCLGDAGYGVLIVLAALFAKRKVGKELKPIASLVSYLGISTIVFGLISGTAFGINLYETGLPGYRQLQALFKANNTDINSILFALALVLGGIQILFGMGIKAANETVQFGFKYALATIGWMILLIGMAVIMGLNKYAGVPMETLKPILYAILGVSGVMILFLNSPGKNIFMNFGLGLWNSYNMITGVLGDLLSYIRLFALGISSAILGFVFNSLALSVGTSIVGIFFMVIILVVGHSINLFMAGLGSFVHPMRLTFVEFYKNAGFTGGGKKYHPFRKLT
ncbi:MAG: V-type ATP synthase subunit I [Lentimicrobium sp.]|nr:V-type ATP synthase subunit I [Lentimicrobium sp.]